MTGNNRYDFIIVGGSYAGLAAGMAIGRALKKVLIIDDDKPCNSQTPFSHNFITQDGKPPAEIAALAKKQLTIYDTVEFLSGLAAIGRKSKYGFEIELESGETFAAKKLIFATGIRDILPGIDGIAASWGISVLHCPYCHGYEIRNEKTGILGNGESGFDLSRLISNWTNDLTLFTNGYSTLTADQKRKLENHQIKIVEEEIERLDHNNGYIRNVIFKNGTEYFVKALYAPGKFEQRCTIPQSLGCAFTDEGYIQVDPFQETTVTGIFACGDNTTRMRTVANAVAMGATAGMTASRKMILEDF